MQPITNYNSYNTEMTKSMMDKMFFLDKVDAEVFIDFGCADGALIEQMSLLFPDHIFIGYDFDEKMLELGRDRKLGLNVIFTSDWNFIIEALKLYQLANLKTAVVLNSFIHEVYSYGTPESIEKFWAQINDTGFDYIIIRDMAMMTYSLTESFMQSEYYIENVKKIRAKADPVMLAEFEKHWGSIDAHSNYVHFLMKYRYKTNWMREVEENYFPITTDQLMDRLSQNYKVNYYDHFCLPFNTKVIFEDFGVDFREQTHVKIILEK